MTDLDDAFVESARKSPRDLKHNDDSVTFTATDLAGGVAAVHAELEVSVEGTVLGYITSFRDDERGVVSADGFRVDAPHTFRTVEDALDYLRPDTPDGRPGHPAQ